MEIIKGWELKMAKWNGGSGVNPILSNESLNIEIIIPNDKLKIFGFYVAGPHLGIIRYESKGTEKEQIDAASDIISQYLYDTIKTPDYWDVKNFLGSFKGKMKLGKIIPASSSTLISIKKVLELLDSEFQELAKQAKNIDK